MRGMGDLFLVWRRAGKQCIRGESRRRASRGGVAVEFAVVLGVLLLLLLGIVEFSVIYKNYMVLQHATREGARIVVVGATSAEAESWVRSFATTLDPARLSVEVRFCSEDGVNFTRAPGVIAVSETVQINDIPSTALVRVRTRYTHRLLTGFALPGRTEVVLGCNMVMQRQ